MRDLDTELQTSEKLPQTVRLSNNWPMPATVEHFRLVSTDEIRRLVQLEGTEEIADRVRNLLLEQIQNLFLEEDPHFVNIRTMSTASDVVIIRRDTLHALLHGVLSGQPSAEAFDTAGWEAGVLYAVDVVRWYQTHSRNSDLTHVFPRNPSALIEAALLIDRGSRWGKVHLPHDLSHMERKQRGTVPLTVAGNFLVHEASRLQDLCYFWRGYITATFSTLAMLTFGKDEQANRTSLGEWFTVLRCEEAQHDMPLGSCTFSLDVGPEPLQVTAHKLACILVDYMEGNFKWAALDSRPILETFMRDLALLPEGEPLRRMKDCFSAIKASGITAPEVLDLQAVWKVREQVEPKVAGALRGSLHRAHHEVIDAQEVSDQEARLLVLSTATKVMRACRAINVPSDRRRELGSRIARAAPKPRQTEGAPAV